MASGSKKNDHMPVGRNNRSMNQPMKVMQALTYIGNVRPKFMYTGSIYLQSEFVMTGVVADTKEVEVQVEAPTGTSL